MARAEPDRGKPKPGSGGASASGKSAKSGSAGEGEERGENLLLDIFLTAPVFVVYHAGVVFLSVRNGLDPVTDLLLSVLQRSLLGYLGITAAVALGFYLAARVIGLHGKLNPTAFALRIGEATIYAFAMWAIAQTVVQRTLVAAGSDGKGFPPFTALIMSLGAGFYEEVGFRVILFGGGALLIRKLTKGWRAVGFEIGWAFAAAAAFSAIHYVGALSDKFQLGSFVFRLTCGLVLTAVFRLRGFAAAVWTHALYDVGVMML